jgi:enoyl-CoA hydratase/carnithine racemase
MVRTEHRDGVRLMLLDRGATNAVNLELVNALSKNLEEAKSSPEVRAVVLASASAKFFCIGFDVPALVELDEKGLRRFYGAYNNLCLDLYTFPKPTVAALAGHAVGGGCILPLCCDYRYAAEGGYSAGLKEVRLGVPVPYLADLIARRVMGERLAREAMFTGDLYGPEQLFHIGFADALTAPEDLLPAAVEKAAALGAKPPQAFAALKRSHVEPVEREYLARREEKEDIFMKCWFSDEGQRLLKEAVAKFSPR